MLAYSGALFIAAAIPGPGITAIVARALGSGFRETFFMGLGLILGDMIYLTAVILGLAFIAQTFTDGLHGHQDRRRPLSRLHRLEALDSRAACRRRSRREARRAWRCRFLSGLLVTLGNPKTMLFYVALVPTLIDLAAIGLDEYGLLLAATFVVLLVVLIPYMAARVPRPAAARKSQRALRTLNRVAAGILAGTAAYIATRAASTRVRGPPCVK